MISAHHARNGFVFLLSCGCALARSHDVMPLQNTTPITASVRHDVTRLDGHHLSADSVERIVVRRMAEAHVPALAMAVIDHGESHTWRGSAYRDVERRLPLTDTTVMYAASLTKAMFAHLVMQLVDEGVIALDTRIETYLPKPLPSYEKYAELAGDARWTRITPRMLLSHTSGLPNWRFMNAGRKARHQVRSGHALRLFGRGNQSAAVRDRSAHGEGRGRNDAVAAVRSVRHAAHEHDVAALVRVRVRARLRHRRRFRRPQAPHLGPRRRLGRHGSRGHGELRSRSASRRGVE